MNNIMAEIENPSKDKSSGRETMSNTDMTAVMEKTMQGVQGRFQTMSEQLETKLDEMGTRIDDLEKNVSELMTQAGMEEQAASK
ncbi:heat shock factor-binding protein 1-like [Anoplopoma fimbria]|uniref:heat shock factor-binding protein 1-like n=1 Tax=Anoplopoma fimbria TaxID=229290 RepID=UPI0023ECDB31|nr:heat shock factor-binding protein 1-like [Anoplopoma fimbria]